MTTTTATATTYSIGIPGSLGFSPTVMATTMSLLELDPEGPDGVADSCAAGMGSIVRRRQEGRGRGREAAGEPKTRDRNLAGPSSFLKGGYCSPTLAVTYRRPSYRAVAFFAAHR